MNSDFDLKRRQFLKFFGVTSSSIALSQLIFSQDLLAKTQTGKSQSKSIPILPATDKDAVSVVDGLTYQRVISWMEPLSKDLRFGSHCDFIAIFPILDDKKKPRKNEILMWVNNEYLRPIQLRDVMYEMGLVKEKKADYRDREFINIEMDQVGGSLVHFKKQSAQWKVVLDSKMNRRITAKTEIQFAKQVEVLGAKKAVGTLANCAGGVTPWGHVLTCEENFHDYYQDVKFNDKGERSIVENKKGYRWYQHYEYPPEHYGWVVEVNPYSGEAKKLTSLGRFAHEGATCVATDKNVVVYMGDDKENEFFYKFISKTKDSLEEGTLYVANIERGEWLSLDINSNKILQKKFKTQLELNIRVREAAKLLGATPLGRPEDCELDPKNKGHVYVNLTSQKVNGKPFGVVLKITEQNGDVNSLKFKSEEFIKGGLDSNFAMPDNMVFDRNGNLWITTDVPDDDLNTGDFKKFGNNSLLYIPMSGEQAGIAHRLLVAPKGAELTGPCFHGNELFISVQHPAEDSAFPFGKDKVSRSSVICVHGPLMNQILEV